MCKKIIAMCLALAMLCSMGTMGAMAEQVAPAAVVEDSQEIMPLYNYVTSTNTTLSISGTTATCYTKIQGISGTTTLVKITMTLQKKSWFTWNDVETWKLSSNTYKGSLNKNRTIESGTYRVKAEYTAYSGTASETFTKYSDTKTC